MELVSFVLSYRTASLDHVLGNHRCYCFGVFLPLAVRCPRVGASILIPGGRKRGCQNSKTGKRLGAHHLESFLFRLVSLSSLCQGSPGPWPCMLWSRINPQSSISLERSIACQLHIVEGRWRALTLKHFLPNLFLVSLLPSSKVLWGLFYPTAFPVTWIFGYLWSKSFYGFQLPNCGALMSAVPKMTPLTPYYLTQHPVFSTTTVLSLLSYQLILFIAPLPLDSSLSEGRQCLSCSYSFFVPVTAPHFQCRG